MKKSQSKVLLLLLVCVSGVSIASSIRPGNEIKQIPFELERNKIILPLKVNSSRRLKVILDTGMPSQGAMLFDPAMSEEIELKNAQRLQVRGAGRGETSFVLRDESVVLSFEDIEFSNQPLMILQNDRLKGFPSDGVVGNVLFGAFAVKIDYDNRLITALDSPSLRIEQDWEAIDLRFNASGIPFIDAAVSVSGEDFVDINIYIDSASGEAIELLVKPDMKFTPPEELEERYLGRGLSGDIYGQFGRVKSFKIGPYTLTDVPATFPEARIRSRQEGADGILCNRALMRFNVIFDYAGKKLYIRPNQSFSLPFK